MGGEGAETGQAESPVDHAGDDKRSDGQRASGLRVRVMLKRLASYWRQKERVSFESTHRAF